MAKLIEKHQQNGQGRGVLNLFSPEQQAEIERDLNRQMRSFHTQQPVTVKESVRPVEQRVENQRRNAAVNRAVRNHNNQNKNNPGKRRISVVPSRTNPDEVKVVEAPYPTPPVIDRREINPLIIDPDQYREQKAEHYRQQDLEEKFYNQVLPATTEFMSKFMPSTWVGAAFDKNKSFKESMLLGNKGLGEIDESAGAGTNLMFDLIAPGAWSKGLKFLRTSPWVGRATNYMTTFKIPEHLGEWARLGPLEFRYNPNRLYSNPFPEVRLASESQSSQIPLEMARRGWEYRRPITLNGQTYQQVWHPKYGFSELEYVNGDLVKGPYSALVTNEALNAYNPKILSDPSNADFVDQLRYVARKMDKGQETPGILENTTGYEYPRLWDIVLRTDVGKTEYPFGGTMVFRGLWPGSSTVAKSPNYESLFIGYNRDMAMPYARIGSSLGGKNNFIAPQYDKYFQGYKLNRLRELDEQIKNLTVTKGYYNQEDAELLQRLHNERAILLGDKLPEFGGLQQLIVPNNSQGQMLKTVMPNGIALEGSTFGDLGNGTPITIPRLTGDNIYYDANAVSGALASEGPAQNIYGVWLNSIHPGFTGIHDKGVGSTLIWGQDGVAPYLKSLHGNSFKNLSGTIESAYKKGGKFK